jgi:pimeloyl-ACP methyl ester carboxylesterase
MRMFLFLWTVFRWLLGIALAFSGIVTAVSGAISTAVRFRERGRGGVGVFATLFGLFREWLATAFLFLLYPLGFLPLKTRMNPNSPLPSLLLIHGYSMNRSTWMLFFLRLKREGFENIVTINLPPFSPIEKDADLVHRTLERYSEILPGKRWVLIGHSMGGLVIRSYLKKYGSDRVLRAYTLGTPHQGTLMAHLGYGKNARQMVPQSSFLEDLLSGEENGKLLLSIASRLDNLVVPWRNALHPRAPALVLSEPIGHNHLVLHPRVFQTIVADLRFFLKAGS